MSSLNLNPEHYTLRLQENLRDIPYTIFEHLLNRDSILRPKQREAVEATANKMFNEYKRAIALIMPTGTGKTVILAQMIAGLKQDEKIGHKIKKILIVTDSEEGVKNTRSKLKEFADIDAGVYYGDEKDIDGKQVIVTTYNSWQDVDFPINAEEIDLTVLDEAHKGISEARQETLQKHDNSIFLALTASPTYDEERDLLKYFDLAFKMTVQEAVEHGLICSFRNIVLNSDIELDLEELSKYDENFDKALQEEVKKEARNRIGIDYLVHGNHYDTGEPLRDIRGIVSCVDTEHAETVANSLNEAYNKAYPDRPFKHGFAQFIAGDTKNRDEILKWHKDGETQYLVYADLLNQNYDDKKIGVVMNLRLTESLVLAIQRGGRSTRLDEQNPGKIALIVDIFHKFKGKFKKQPLFYAHAIGSAALITKEVEHLAIERSFGFSKVAATRKDEAKHEAQAMRFNITTDEESILAIFNNNQLQIYKQADELSSVEVAAEYGVASRTVKEIFDRFVRLDDTNFYFDPDEKTDREPILFHMMERKISGNDCRCLKDFELNKFGEIYLNFPLKNELTAARIAKRLRTDSNKISSKKIRQIFDRLLVNAEGLYFDPEERVDTKPTALEVVFRRVNKRDNTPCLKESSWDDFIKACIPKVLKQPNELSAVDFQKRGKISYETALNILNRLQPLIGSEDLYFDPLSGNKDNPTTFRKVIRRGPKGDMPCLKIDDGERFEQTYALTNLKEKSLSVLDLGKKIGVSPPTIRTILERLKLVDGASDKYIDPADKNPDNPTIFYIETKTSSGGDKILCFSNAEAERFEQTYFPYGVKKEDELSYTDITKRYIVGTKRVMNIFKNLQRDKNNKNLYYDPNNKNVLFEVEFRHSRQDSVWPHLKENSMDLFAKTYNLKPRRAGFENSPS